jgi:glutamate dehydrogenase (NAD(P)+)
MKKDKFGPEYIIEVHDPKIGMTGFLVVDNTVLGPGKGGIRMTSNVTAEEVYRLARTMTWKNSLAGIPFGGAKAGIVWPGGSNELKKEFIQSFARMIKPFIPKKYIAGPDVNTGEKEMQWIVEAVNNWRAATGKPANLCRKTTAAGGTECGLPHELGSTGFGVSVATAEAIKQRGIDIKGATVAIHGFGNVGTFTYEHLTKMGAKIVALADKDATIYNKDGFDDNMIEKFIKERRSLNEFPNSQIKNDDFWKIPVDVLIPASVTDVINETNKNDIKAKIIVEAGNIPMREHIEEELSKKGIMIVPDFVANAGGVISSYAEYKGYDSRKMFELVENKIRKATASVLKKSIKESRNPREVAMEIAMTKVEAKAKTK